MSQVLVTNTYLEDIADAIRLKNGSQETYTPAEMAPAIANIIGVPEGYLLPSGTLEISQNGQYDVGQYANVNVNFQQINAPQGHVTQDASHFVILSPESGMVYQTKNVTPSASAQTITADSGYDALQQVNVAAVTLQSKTVTPNDSAQTITANSGYHGLSSVTVNAVDSTVYMHISDTQTYYTGTTDPASSLGAEGDIYLKVAP